jgi:hypothetical protein
LKEGAPVNAKEASHKGTPLGWGIYGWADPGPEFEKADYYGVVELLTRAGATVDCEWMESSSRGSSLATRARADKRMMAVLKGKD